MKTALILGVPGQDGSYLAEFLLAKGYEVHGTKRRSSSFNTARIDHLMPHPAFFLHYGDVTDAFALSFLINRIRPDEVYNLAAQSHVAVSFELERHSVDVAGIGALNVFQAVRMHRANTRIYQAGTSEMFGTAQAPQDESSPFRPPSPYACAKVFAHHMALNYRQSYGMFIANGILFNHESPRRGETFVTRKITRGLARIKGGLETSLHLGNLDAERDWGFAGDYVEAMWLMLQHHEPDDFVVATQKKHSVRDVLTVAAARLEMDWTPYVEMDSSYLRPAEVPELRGVNAKARKLLGWQPKVGFKELIQMMADHDWKEAQSGKRL